MEGFYKIFLLIFGLAICYLVWHGSEYIPNVYGNGSKLIFSPTDKPYNQTYANFTKDWWLWHLSIPQPHPRDHYSPDKCSLNQTNRHVWFLADGMGRDNIDQPEERACQVPAGKALLVQIVGSGCSKVEGYKTDEELKKCADWILDRAIITAEVDGQEVINTIKNPNDKSKNYINPFITNLTYVPHNIYDYKPGTYRGMVSGYYLFVRPLSPGQHEISFKEIDENCPGGSLGPSCDKRDTNVKYLLNILPSTPHTRTL
jgi:hypothetical protein